jgi:hypothetical protein
LAATLLLIGLEPPPASAAMGVALTLGKIEPGQPLSRGGVYTLPVLGVRNPGNETTHYRMGLAYVNGQAEQRVPEGWLRFSQGEFALAPGSNQAVAATIKVPIGATPGDYSALLQAAIVPAGGGTTVGAAAAARLTFVVRPSSMLEAWFLTAQRLVGECTPWSYLLPAVLLAVSSATWLMRRFSFRLERRA